MHSTRKTFLKIFFIISFLTGSLGLAQSNLNPSNNLFNAVGIAFDSTNNRHLISYFGSTAGLSITSNGSGIVYFHDYEKAKFLVRSMHPKSLIIWGSILYYIDGRSVCSFDLIGDSVIKCSSFTEEGIDFQFDDFCTDTSGNFYLTSYSKNMLVKFTPDSNKFQSLIENSDEFLKPYGITYSSSLNRIFVATYQIPSLIYKIKKDSAIIELIDTTNISNPMDIVIDNNLRFYLPDTQTGKIVRLNQNFTIDTSFVSEIYHNPNQILLRNDSLWVTESSKDALIIPSGIVTDTKISMPDTLVRILRSGWNWISSCVNPYFSGLDSVFTGIDSLQILKLLNGDSYLPTYHINNIGPFKVEDGYQLYTPIADTIKFKGAYCDPTFISLPLAYGWNMIPYLFKDQYNVTYYLANLHSGNLVIAKNEFGNSYIPQFNLNSIGLMKPGFAYEIFLAYPDTLYFVTDSTHHNEIKPNNNNNSQIPIVTSDQSNKSKDQLLREKIVADIDNAETSTTLVIKGDCYKDGVEIGAFKGNNVFGKATFSQGFAVLNVWGNDRFSKGKGAKKSDAITLKVWDDDSGKLKQVNAYKIKNMLDKSDANDIRFDKNVVLYVELCN